MQDVLIGTVPKWIAGGWWVHFRADKFLAVLRILSMTLIIYNLKIQNKNFIGLVYNLKIWNNFSLLNVSPILLLTSNTLFAKLAIHWKDRQNNHWWVCTFSTSWNLKILKALPFCGISVHIKCSINIVNFLLSRQANLSGASSPHF